MSDTPSTDAEVSKRRNSRKRNKAIKKWLKRAAWVIVGAAVIFMAVRAFMPKPVPVDAAKATKTKMVVTIDEDGKTRIKDRYVVLAPLTGNMVRIDFQPGDAVKHHAAIARILPTTPTLLDARTRSEARARLAAAIAGARQARALIGAANTAWQQAKADVKRNTPLAAKGAVSRVELERSQFLVRSRREELRSARFAARVASENVSSARAALGFLTKKKKGDKEEPQLVVTAPTNGSVLRVFRRDEGVVAAGTKLVELGDPSHVEVVADILTRDAVKIREGARVTIHRWGGGIPLKGHVHRVEPSAFQRISALGVEEQRVNVIVHIENDRKQWSALGDGYRVEVSIVIWQRDDVLTVPTSSVFRSKKGWAVFTIDKGKARLTPIQVGQRNPKQVQVLGGLSAGTEVVLHPGDQVSDGVRVSKRNDAH